MKKIGILLFIMGLLWAVPSWATLGVELGDGILHVTMDGTNSFDWNAATVTAGRGLGQKIATIYPNGIALTSIDWWPSASGAIGIWRNKTTSGMKMGPKFNSIDGGPQTKYMTGMWLRKPSIVHGDQTTDTNTEWFFNFDPND